MTDSRRLELLHDLTANYSDRQGLRIVPVGLAIVAQALPWGTIRYGGLGIGQYLLIAAVIAYSAIGRLYARRFGSVEELPYPGAPLLLQSILVLLLLLAAMAVDIIAEPPLFVSGLLIAFWIALSAWPARAVRAQYLGIALLLALVSLLPAAGLARESVARIYGIAFGTALVVSGIADHILFTRLLQEPAHE
ncbi:MAG TPA: hypothetical protein VF824_11270 [Thermoanaerobaculia bacterium]|jgi:hypothetical protein